MRIVHTRDYQDAYRNLVRVGARHGQKARKAAGVIGNLEMGLPPGAPTTNYGESRIRHCVKYDLGDGFRLITLLHGQTCLTLYVGDHEASDEWLIQHEGLSTTFNPETQEVILVTLPPVGTGRLRAGNPTLDPRPFLKRLDGLDWVALIPNAGFRFALLAIGEDHDLQAQWDLLSEFQSHDPDMAARVIAALNHLQHGQNEEARAVFEVSAGERVVESDSLTLENIVTDEVLANPVNAERFIHLNPLSEEERKLLEDPSRFQEWMVFLHPGQKRVVDEDFELPAVLTGVSGSGKTCVLVHRARRLARLYPKERILVLTLNRSLARLLENLILTLCVDGEDARIDVRSFHDYLAGVLASVDLARFLDLLANYTDHVEEIRSLLAITAPDRLEELFKSLDERVLKAIFLEFTEQLDGPERDNYDNLEIYLYSQDQALDLSGYLYEELELIRSAFPCYGDYREYRDGYERVGRSIQFQTERRQQVLTLLHAWEGYQIRRRFFDHMGLTQAAMLAVDETDNIPSLFRYRAVLVDEFQDFSTTDLNLLRRIPTESKNGLFLTGDFAQKLFAKELDFPKAGLGRQNRTIRSIRKNYRNSRQILLAADRLLKTFPPPAQNGDSELSVLDPELAERDSAQPIAVSSLDPVRHAWEVVDEWLQAGHIAFSVCIATANTQRYSLEAIRTACPGHIKVSDLTGDYFLDPSIVVVSDIATIKGFEFSLIIILGLEDGAFPLPGRPREERWRDALRLYVATTRGRDEVRFIYSNKASAFLLAMGDALSWREAPEAPVAGAQLETRDAAKDLPAVVSPEIGAGSDERLLVEFLNGFAIANLPRGITERRLVSALGKKPVEVAISIQRVGVFTSPDSPLSDHIVRKVCEDFGLKVNFRLRQQSEASSRAN